MFQNQNEFRVSFHVLASIKGKNRGKERREVGLFAVGQINASVILLNISEFFFFAESMQRYPIFIVGYINIVVVLKGPVATARLYKYGQSGCH